MAKVTVNVKNIVQVTVSRHTDKVKVMVLPSVKVMVKVIIKVMCGTQSWSMGSRSWSRSAKVKVKVKINSNSLLNESLRRTHRLTVYRRHNV